MNGVQAKKILSYVMLPQVIPRAKVLFASGFGYIAFLMASIYGAVRLLPAGHPYLDPRNIGKFGVHHVIVEAANRLVLKKENIDQIVVFVALLSGAIILLLQLALLVYTLLFTPAMAASYFQTPHSVTAGNNTLDMAFIVLDQVFGVPNMFSADEGGTQQFTTINATLPWPFHVALHEMFRFYSYGLLFVGIFIFLYYVVVIIGETATTGSPFGQRFQNAWTPVRLVVALGLLVPFNYGLNTSQYIVLYAAKYGSSFASQGWKTFNETMKDNPVFGGNGANPSGENKTLLARPLSPSMMPMVQMMSLAHACAYLYWKLDPRIKNNSPTPPSPNFYIKPYLVKSVEPGLTDPNDYQEVTATTSYKNAMTFYNNSDIVIRFGERDVANEAYKNEKGNVKSLCGDVRIPINYLKTIGEGGTYGGPDYLQEYYYNMVLSMWFSPGILPDMAQRYVEVELNIEPNLACTTICGPPFFPACGSPTCATEGPNGELRQTAIITYSSMFDAAITVSWTLYNMVSTDVEMRQEVLDRGWAGAAIWYNTIAEINGAYVSAVNAMPTFESYPDVMEQAREEHRKNDTDTPSKQQFKLNLANGKAIDINGKQNSLAIAQKLNSFFIWWNEDDPDMTKADITIGGGIIENTIHAIFGIRGLFAMRGDNAAVHPLALLASVGKSLVDSAIINIGTSSITAGIGGILRAMDQHSAPGAAAELASNMTMTIAFLGLTAGFILYYVLPFLPFLYFFFAFGTWIKSIFEAMVGAPLWALAHLRIDGEGLPGDSASSGYFLVFDVFIRPILTVFGLLASVLILTAQVRILNVTWDLVLSNLTGFEGYTADAVGQQQIIQGNGYVYKPLPRNTVDQFFFTIVYAIIVYMMANASFKLIDKIPDQLLRFMGAGVSTFSDINPDTSGELTRYAALGGITVGREITGGLRGLSGSMGGSLGQGLKEMVESAKGTQKPPGTG